MKATFQINPRPYYYARYHFMVVRTSKVLESHVKSVKIRFIIYLKYEFAKIFSQSTGNSLCKTESLTVYTL